MNLRLKVAVVIRNRVSKETLENGASWRGQPSTVQAELCRLIGLVSGTSESLSQEGRLRYKIRLLARTSTF